jgi:hypothetical protein
MEVTVEVSCCKYPSALELETIWNQNRKSLIEYAKQVNRGIKGIITWQNFGPAQHLGIKIDNREPIFKSNENGEYYRILLPGEYKLRLLLNCDVIHEEIINIPNTSQNQPLVRNIVLNDSLYFKSKTYTLSRHAQFCESKRAIATCGSNRNAPLDFIIFFLFLIGSIYSFV